MKKVMAEDRKMREKEREKELERVALSRSLPEAPAGFNLSEVHRTAQLKG